MEDIGYNKKTKDFEACLIWSKLESGRIMHFVVSYDGEKVYIISAYEPDDLKFIENYKIRRKE